MSLLRKFGNYLLKSDNHASAAALIFSTLGFLGLPTGFLSLIILALVSLVKGPRSGAMVLAWAVLPALCMWYLHQWAVLDLMNVVRCVLIWGLASLFRLRASWRWILELEAMFGVLMVSIFYLVIGNVHQWWTQFLDKYFARIELQTQLNISKEQLQEFVQQVIPYATGLVVLGILLGIFVLLLLARWWQKALIFTSDSIAVEFAAIRMSWPDIVVVLLILAALLFTQKAVLLDLMPVLLFPFVVAGLSVLHYGANRKKSERLCGGNFLSKALRVVLVISYLALIFVPWLAGGFLSLLGIVDSGFDIRKKVFDRKRVKA